MRQDKWDELSTTEKVSTLQTIANIEAYYLGLPHELNVEVKILKGSTIAQYWDPTHTITVNKLYLETMDARKALNSLCHECFHAYQHRLCDVYNSLQPEHKKLQAFYNVPSYLEEFQTYISGSDDYDGYYYQTCEIMARNYAVEGVSEYYSKIERYS